MDMAIKDQWNGQQGQNSQDDPGKVKVVYMACTKSDTITYSREDLENIKCQDAYQEAVNELRDWLHKHAGQTDLVDLHEAISHVMLKTEKK